METVIMKRIVIFDRLELAKEFVKNDNISVGVAFNIVNTLNARPDEYHISEYTHSWLKDCKYISYSFDSKSNYVNTYNYSIVSDSGNIENVLGLTDAERWFNTLSNEHKKYVKELGSFFSPPACAG